MIQSDIFDSFNMDIKKITSNAILFITKRLIELSGFLISLFGFVILLALITYSPEDPNFIFSEGTEIKNLLGFQGSFLSDIFFSRSLNNFCFCNLNYHHYLVHSVQDF